MPTRSRKGYTDFTPAPHTYTVVLDCGHERLMERPLPQVGDRVKCGSCVTATVKAVDERELTVVCDECPRHKIATFHRKATITASTRAAVHNVREKRGHRARVIETGNVLGTP